MEVRTADFALTSEAPITRMTHDEDHPMDPKEQSKAGAQLAIRYYEALFLDHREWVLTT